MDFLRNAILTNYAPVIVRYLLIALGTMLASKGLPPEFIDWLTGEGTIAAITGAVVVLVTAAWGLIKRPSPAGMEAAKAVDKGVEATIKTPPGQPDMIVKPKPDTPKPRHREK